MAECPNWWDKPGADGKCVSETWRKSTAIAVPVAVVAVAVVVVAVVCVVRRRRINAQKEVVMRKTVAGDA